LKREIITTKDGSKTIQLPEWNEQYHSIHGAVAEARHVFIQAGLQHWLDHSDSQDVSIMEIGFGTGLNAFLTFLEAEHNNINVNYTGIEAYPVLSSEIVQLNYAKLVSATENDFLKLHEVEWEQPSLINSNFNLTKRKQFFSEINEAAAFDLIYFDAFGPRVQPELWTEAIFKIMYLALKQDGVLVTYSAKGSVRRAMQAVGFTVERLAGPPGKREMLRASKSN